MVRAGKLLITLVVALVVAAFGSMPAMAVSYATITASGSSWSAVALNTWITDVTNEGIHVVFNASGSAIGRSDFSHSLTDFGVSDIAYQGDQDGNTNDTSNGRPFAYVPVVGGGTSFPYHIGNGANQIRNLRLSGLTIAKIFTDQIKYWDDPEIEADNNNALRLPHLPIVPVVHSEGSGSTAQFTAYLAKEYPQIWQSFSGTSTMTEFFPAKAENGVKQYAQNGSDGVINFLSSAAGNGTIAFDEYAYALQANEPVAKVLNAAGYYTAPTQYATAVALTQAKIDTTDVTDPTKYLTQNLDNVYTYGDPRTYPLSSYSYVIMPTTVTNPADLPQQQPVAPWGSWKTESKTTKTNQRQAIADFLYYSLCQGQDEIGPRGYTSLPVNLVEAGFNEIAKLKQADPNVDLTNRDVSTCHNPTFIPGNPNGNYLAKIAPLPPACDKQGAGPCGSTVGIVNGNPVNGKAPTQNTAAGSGSGGSGNGGGGAAGGGGGSNGSGDGGAGNGGNVSGPVPAGPTVGTAGQAGPATSGAARISGGPANAGPAAGASSGTSQIQDAIASSAPSTAATVAASDVPQSKDLNSLLVVLMILLLLVVLIAPPLLAWAFSGHRGGRT